MSLKPYIEGETVKKIEVEGQVIPARNTGFPISDLPEVIGALSTLQKYLDFESIGSIEEEAKEWSKKEIFDFLEERNERQLLFFRVLAENKEIGRTELLKMMAKELGKPSFDGKVLAGALGGIGIRTNSLEKEPLYDKEEREDDDEWEMYYWLIPSYAPIIEEWLKEEE